MRTKFNFLLSIIICSVFLFACNGNGNGVTETPLTDTEKNAEKAKIQEVLQQYNTAANEKNWTKMITTLASDVTFFGTDSGEVSKNMSEFKNTMQKQWQEYEVLNYGEVKDVYIEIDDYARFANVIYGTSLTAAKKGEKPEVMYVVFQRTLQKENSTQSWVIKSGILAVSRIVK